METIQHIGEAKPVHFEDWIAYINALTYDDITAITKDLRAYFVKPICGPQVPVYNYTNVEQRLPVVQQRIIYALTKQLQSDGYVICGERDTRTEQLRKKQNEASERLRKVLRFATEYNQPIHVAYWDEKVAYCYMGDPEQGFIVLDPAKYMEFIPDKDYSELTPVEVRKMLGGAGGEATGKDLVSAEAQNTLTPSQVRRAHAELDRATQDVQSQITAAKKCETGELAELKRQMEALEQELEDKQRALMAELDDKLFELNVKKDQMEASIFMLDAQIYDICCYAGETVRFMRVRSGKDAPTTEPVVVYQKLRFLDEDLGRIASIYEIQWGEIDMFEDFLRHSPEAQEVFCPNPKCVTLVRVSKTGKLQFVSQTKYYGMLTQAEYFHGKTVGIIIRNGDNIYLGWTDEGRVHIEDDLIITKNSIHTTEVKPAREPRDAEERKQFYEQQKEDCMNVMDGVVSRRFVYSVLQGIVDNSTLLGLPKGTDIGKPGPLVAHSVADFCLEDNRFGLFGDIVARCNRHATKGDTILTMMSILPYGADNDRGIGYANRTHDTKCPDCEILTTNLVTDYERTRMYRLSFQRKLRDWEFLRYREDGETPPEVILDYTNVNADDYDAFLKGEGPAVSLSYTDDIIVSDITIEREFWKISKTVYVSLEKEGDYWRPRGAKKARANFQLFSNEYINLTYMNSAWLLYAINNKKLGGWQVDGTDILYARAIRYLKTALEFIQKREAREKELLDAIDPAICQDPEWMVKLSEWKLLNDARPVRNMNEYQAKRFAKYVNDRR